MKTFNVYQHPLHGYEAVKVGFSWPAFFFGALWMLVKKLWAMAGLWIVLYIVCSVIEKATDQAQGAATAQIAVYLALSAAYFALWLVPPFKGNQWRESNLIKRGYTLVTTVQAKTPDAALAQQASLVS